MQILEHLFLVGEFPARDRLLSGLTLEQVTLCPDGASHSIYEELWHVVSYQQSIIAPGDPARDVYPSAAPEHEHQWHDLVRVFLDGARAAAAMGQAPGINILDTPDFRTYIVCMSIANRTTDKPGPKVPKGLHDAIIYFADKERVLAFAVAYRWPEGVTCPYCASSTVSFLSTRSIWKCLSKDCRKQFSVKVGTIFEDSPISLSKWFTAMWMLTNCKNGVSSYEIHRALNVTQKTAWFMLHRIRAAMKAKSFDKKLCGIVEADECHVGGLMENMHKDRREKIKGGRKANSATGKTIVQAVLERSGVIRTQVLNDLSLAPRLDFLKANVDGDAKVMTDEGYNSPRVDSAFEHEFVNHKLEYVRGNVHCNGVENFWSLLQRGLSGTYIAVEPEHLGAYVDEQAFRYNNRKDDDGGRFEKTLTQTTGVRLTYKELIRAN